MSIFDNYDLLINLKPGDLDPQFIFDIMLPGDLLTNELKEKIKTIKPDLMNIHPLEMYIHLIPKFGYNQIFDMYPMIKLALAKIRGATDQEIEDIKIREKNRTEKNKIQHINLKLIIGDIIEKMTI